MNVILGLTHTMSHILYKCYYIYQSLLVAMHKTIKLETLFLQIISMSYYN